MNAATPRIIIISVRLVTKRSSEDFIFLYLVDGAEDAFGIGGTGWMDKPVVAVDIRTTYKRAEISDIRAHLIKIKDEVFRIIKANVANPDTDHQLLVPLRRRDLSDKHTGVGRMVIDVSLKYWGN